MTSNCAIAELTALRPFLDDDTKEAVDTAIVALKSFENAERLELIRQSVCTLLNTKGDDNVSKAFRNAGRLVKNAMDGEYPDFEKIDYEKGE